MTHCPKCAAELGLVTQPVTVDHEVVHIAVSKYNEIWENFPKPIDSKNVDFVRRIAMQAALLAVAEATGIRTL